MFYTPLMLDQDVKPESSGQYIGAEASVYFHHILEEGPAVTLLPVAFAEQRRATARRSISP